MRTTRITTIAAAAALVGLPLAVGPASADDHTATELTAELTQLNDSGATGTAWAKVHGTEVEIELETAGLLDGAPHAQHIHIGGQGVCPSNDQEGSGFEGALQVSDAADQYGGVAVSLTTEPGETGPDAALDVDNFPTGASNTYSRTITVSDEVAQQIANGDGVVVVHGVDHDGSGAYDGDTESDLDPSLPSEATDPAACGELNVVQMAMPEGGVETGGADTAGIEQPAALGLGALAMGLGVLGFTVIRRRTTN